MPIGAAQLLPPRACVADLMKEVVECPSSPAVHIATASPRRVIATCGSLPSGSERHRFSAEMFSARLQCPRKRVAAKTTHASTPPASIVARQTTTALRLPTAICGSLSPDLASLKGRVQPCPGRRLLTWIPFGRPPSQTTNASPSGVTAIRGGPDSRPVTPRVTGSLQLGAALATSEAALRASTATIAAAKPTKRLEPVNLTESANTTRGPAMRRHRRKGRLRFRSSLPGLLPRGSTR